MNRRIVCLSSILLLGSFLPHISAQWTPVPAVNFSTLQLSQFADNELEVPYYLYHFARVANAVVENDFVESGSGRFLPRGFLNIKVNREPVDNEPYNARIMEMQSPLAYFYCVNRPWNVYRGNNAVRVRLEAMLQRWCAMQNQPGTADGDFDGLFAEYSATGWNLAATGFGVMHAAEALDLIKDSGLPFDATVFEAGRVSLRRALMAMFTRPDMRSAARTYSNQFSGSYHAALVYLENWPDAELDAAFVKAINDSAAQDQSPAGFWYEQGGPDFGYSGVHESNLKTALTRLRLRTDLLPVVVDFDTTWNEWLAAMYVPQPGLTTRTFLVNAGLDTRTSFSYLTPASRPYSEFVVPSRIFSLTDTEYAASLVTRRSQVQAQFGTWGTLTVPSSGSYTTGFVFNAVTPLNVWHPTAAERNAAHATLPCLAADSFNRLYRDALPLSCAVAKRPQYYAAASAGRIRVTRQVYGLGLLWNPGFGLALQSVASDVATNTWMFGTRRAGQTGTYETATTTATVTAGGSTVTQVNGVTGLAAGNLVLSYPLAASGTTYGQKSITMGETNVAVSVTHSGSFTETLPLAYASDAQLSSTATTVVLARPNGSSCTIEVTSAGATLAVGNTSNLVTGMVRRLVTISASGSLAYRLTLTGLPAAPANAYNLDTFSGGTSLWPNDSIWNPNTNSGAGPLAADNIGINGDLTGTTNLNYASGTAANRTITRIDVTDSNSGSGSGAQVNFSSGVAESHLDFATNSPVVATNIVNQNSGANRLMIENPRFQPGSILTKGGPGNLRLNLLSASSVASFQNNVTLLGAGGGVLWLSPNTGTPLGLPDVNFQTFQTGLALTKGAFSAAGKTINLGTGRLTMGDSATLDLTGTTTVTGGSVVMGSNNSGEFYMGGGATIQMSADTASFQNLNMGDQKNSAGDIAYNQLAGTTLISNAAYLGGPSNGNTGNHAENFALNVSGGTFRFTRTSGNTDFQVGRNARTAGTGVITLNGSLNVSGTGVLDLGNFTRMVIGTDTSTLADPTSGILNLNGGTLITAREIARGANTNGGGSDSSIVNLNGGILQTTAAIPELFLNFGNTATNGVLVSAGGASIDTNGFDSASSKPLRENAASTGGGLSKLGAGTLTLAGPNGYGGATTIHAGTLTLSGANDILPVATTVAVAGGCTLDLGGNSQTVKTLALGAGSYDATVTQGDLIVQGYTGNLNLSPAQTTNGQAVTLDMSGLRTFTYGDSSKVIQIGGGGTYGNTLALSLSVATNTLSASALSMYMGGSGSWPFNGATLRLGAANTLNLGTGTGNCINLSGYRSSGNTITFIGNPSSSSLKIRAANGTSRAGGIAVSAASSGTSAGQPITASFDLGVTDALVGEIVVADTVQTGTGVNVIGTMTMAGGTLDATSMTLGRVNTAGTPTNINTLNGSFTQSGGFATIATLTLGNGIAGGTQTTGTIPCFESTYTLGQGATLITQSINANPSGRAFRSTSVRNLNLNGGTLRNATASDLTVSGADATAAGRINIVLGGANNTFDASPGQTIDIQATAPVSGTGNLVKQGAGSLSLKSASTYSGETIVNAGTLQITTNDTLAVGYAVRLAAGTTLNLTFSGEDTVDRLFINATEQASGTWGSLASGATHKTALISGPGILNVANGIANYATWAADNHVTGGPGGDSDSDGIRNLIEYALNLNPAASDGAAGVFSGNTLTFTKRPAAISNGDVSWVIETSATMAEGSWIPAVTHAAGNNAATISYTFTPGSPDKNFARLKVIQLP